MKHDCDRFGRTHCTLLLLSVSKRVHAYVKQCLLGTAVLMLECNKCSLGCAVWVQCVCVCFFSFSLIVHRINITNPASISDVARAKGATSWVTIIIGQTKKKFVRYPLQSSPSDSSVLTMVDIIAVVHANFFPASGGLSFGYEVGLIMLGAAPPWLVFNPSQASGRWRTHLCSWEMPWPLHPVMVLSEDGVRQTFTILWWLGDPTFSQYTISSLLRHTYITIKIITTMRVHPRISALSNKHWTDRTIKIHW